MASDTEVDVLEYSQQVLDSTLAHNDPEAFVYALGLMAKITLQDIIKMDAYGRLSLFVKCVIANRLWLVREYLRKMGYGTSNG